jgi:hypothetical protein
MRLVATARAHNVTVNEARVSFVTNGTVTVAHAPLVGIEKYTDSDFAAGVPLQILYVDAPSPINLPRGAYLVRVQFARGASEGKVSFIDARGKRLTHQLLVRTQRQAAVVFPDVYTNPPSADVPVITSTHQWIEDPAHPGDPAYGHWGVDCSGWQPYRTLYYW